MPRHFPFRQAPLLSTDYSVDILTQVLVAIARRAYDYKDDPPSLTQG
jgi:hypothetical protein